MIPEKKSGVNVTNLKNEFGELITRYGAQEGFDDLEKLAAIMQVYAGAMREVSAKLENLDDAYTYRNLSNPIHHMVSRLKSFDSILGKLKRRNLPLTITSMQTNLRDIAGIRVICNYIDDVYTVSDLLSRQADVHVLRVKDYIRHPKPNGYRSLHLILTVPVYLLDGPHITPVEVQLRTVAMDYWASLEHELRYKNQIPDSDAAKHARTLLSVAKELRHVEETMQKLHHDIEENDRKILSQEKALPKQIDVRV